jgi:uncharacterized protein YgbK (DUF1537 family)
VRGIDGAEAPRVLGLVADDLTGAADSAAGFAEQGWRVSLHLDTRSFRGVQEAPQTVLAVTTGSRALPDDEAAAATAGAVEALAGAGVDRLYLKIDSTVRGSVAGQLSGALAAWSHRYGHAAAMICPAFPAQGRTVVGSRLLVDGIPVGHTASATDPVTPQTVSDLRSIIPGAVPGMPGDAAPQLILDAATDADLDAIAAHLGTAGPEVVMVGSGGLAAALARAWSPTGVRRKTPATNGRILIAISSLHPVTASQVDRLDRAAGVDVLTTRTVSVTPEAAAAELADRVASALARRAYGALVVVGGDGAAAVLARLGADSIAIDGAIVGGCPTGIVRSGIADGLRLVTKSGGFGSPDALTTITIRLLAGSRLDEDQAASRLREKETP